MQLQLVAHAEEALVILLALPPAKMIFLSPILMVMIALGTPKTLTAVVNMTAIPLMQLQLVAHAGEALEALLILTPLLALSLMIGIR